jgi:hypothetical protein
MTMDDATVPTVLDAVRRHLWREEGRVAIRRAAWASAASMLLAVAAHLLARPVPVAALLFVIALLWISMLAWAASRRPIDRACAIWIDRHLGGTSAFTTWLDLSSGSQEAASAPAVRWLRQWTAAKVPEVLRALGARRPSMRVSRSLLSMTVCAVLAIFVLMLPHAAVLSSRPASAPVASGLAEKATSAVDAPVAAQLASEISTALRSSEPQGEPQRGGADGTPGNGPIAADDGNGSPKAPPTSASPGDASVAGDSSSAPSVDAAGTATASRSAAAVAGRESGDSSDTRADVGVSPVPRGTIPGQRSASTARLDAAERRADMGSAATFDESLSMPGRAWVGAAPAAAAATPPPAADTARLSPTETTYVQAWMKATGPSR